MRRFFWLVMILCGWLAPVHAPATMHAQDARPAPVAADNVARLGSVLRVDFADAPETVENGWLTVSADGSRVAVMTARGGVLIYDANDGRVLDSYTLDGGDGLPAMMLDGAFDASAQIFASLHEDGAAFYVVYRRVETGALESFRLETRDTPLRVWMGDGRAWLEVAPYAPGTGAYIVALPDPFAAAAPRLNVSLDLAALDSIPSAPEHDPDAFARIGRIPPPYAVTSSADGLVKVWQLQTGDLLAQVQVENTIVGFGGLDAGATHLAWRDPESLALHLLNFADGRDRVIAPLNGTYIQFILLAPGADVVLGVNVGDEPGVTAWAALDGERQSLGRYRHCNRVPDMARLSRDGTTLVVGCDTGLDIWRVQA